MKYFILTIVALLIFILGATFQTKVVVAEPHTDCEDYYLLKDYAKCIVTEKWGEEQWEYFDWVMNKESNWNPQASNPDSSAFGIPQALTKTHDLPCDYKTNSRTQIDWAVEYIKERYKTPYEAKQHHLRANWY